RLLRVCLSLLFLFNDTATPHIYPLSLHDALPIFQWVLDLVSNSRGQLAKRRHFLGMDQICLGRLEFPIGLLNGSTGFGGGIAGRSEEHTSELQSLTNLVCRLLLEKKKQY